MGIAASLPDVPKAPEPARLEPLRPQERGQEPAPTGGEKARLSETPGGRKSLSMLHYIRGPAPKDVPVPLSHSVNGKSKPWEPFVAEEFAHQFHESVLQSTQKALQKHKGNEAADPTPLPGCLSGWCPSRAPHSPQGTCGAWRAPQRQVLSLQARVEPESAPRGQVPGWGGPAAHTSRK